MKTGLQYIAGKTYLFNDDGYMQTGKVSSIEEIDGDTFSFYFNTKNSGKGQGYTGEKDGYLYFNGKRLEADDDYRIYYVNGNYYVVNNKGKLQKTFKEKDLELPDGTVQEDVTISSIAKKTYKIAADATITSDGFTATLDGVAAAPHIQLDDTDNMIIPDAAGGNYVMTADETDTFKGNDFLLWSSVKDLSATDTEETTEDEE